MADFGASPAQARRGLSTRTMGLIIRGVWTLAGQRTLSLLDIVCSSWHWDLPIHNGITRESSQNPSDNLYT